MASQFLEDFLEALQFELQQGIPGEHNFNNIKYGIDKLNKYVIYVERATNCRKGHRPMEILAEQYDKKATRLLQQSVKSLKSVFGDNYVL